MGNHIEWMGKSALVVCSIMLPMAANSGTVVSDFVEIIETTGVGTSLELSNGPPNTLDRDWSIFNDAANNLLSFGYFSNDILRSIPFILENNAPTASLRITSDGFVGLGTNTPGGPLSSRLTVSDDSRPSIFFDKRNSPENWSMGASSSSGMFIANNFSSFLSILPSGNVGLSSGVPPEAKLHVGGTNDAKILAKNSGNGNGTKVMFNLENGGGIRFDMLDRSTGDNWVFQNQFGTFDVTLAGTGTREFRFYPNGNLEISGAYLQSSSRSIKHAVEPVDQQEVLAKVVALPINHWSYNRERGVRHMGPMSEDFYASFGLGGTSKGITTVDAGGVALAAIQGLKQEKDTEIDLLKARLQQQDERMQQLEMALVALQQGESDTMTVSASADVCTASPAISL